MWGWFFLDKQPHASADMWFSEISFLPKEFGTMTVKLNRFFFKPKPIVIQDNKAISFSKQVDFIWLDVELWASRLHYENVGCCVSTFMSVLCPLLPQGCTSEAKKKKKQRCERHLLINLMLLSSVQNEEGKEQVLSSPYRLSFHWQ